jgi:hypothetical protein
MGAFDDRSSRLIADHGLEVMVILQAREVPALDALLSQNPNETPVLSAVVWPATRKLPVLEVGIPSRPSDADMVKIALLASLVTTVP